MPHEPEEPILCAIDTGYRHIDCALAYGNEAEIGRALKKKLDDGTLWSDSHCLKDVRPGCEKSLRDLGLKYLDLYLVHYPMAFKVVPLPRPYVRSAIEFENVPLEETWKGMEELVEAGLVRSIGVSNFNKAQLERILAVCKIPPAVNQVEVTVNFPNQKLLDYCSSKGIHITAFSPFGCPGLIK
ncbi:unnamed protein product [Dibothriocephalus latus]|uniref:NADP-dependent oxidoreductase domain-containing protein n=1 Tax=Dibothriocephalus latus TaxID=60516 RepID=A0A3P7KYX3_DIBLA|nr:unnamed protein product [Dibothriocephalus latus]